MCNFAFNNIWPVMSASKTFYSFKHWEYLFRELIGVAFNLYIQSKQI